MLCYCTDDLCSVQDVSVHEQAECVRVGGLAKKRAENHLSLAVRGRWSNAPRVVSVLTDVHPKKVQ